MQTTAPTESLRVYVGDEPADRLIRRGSSFRFLYGPAYEGPPVLLGLPVKERERIWDCFPPHFENLLPEGPMLDQLLRTHKLDITDRWGQLRAVGGDVVGFLTLSAEVEDERAPAERFAGHQLPDNDPLPPRENSLPYSVAEVVTFNSRRPLRMSIPGVQPKVSATLGSGTFHIVPSDGQFILKPSPAAYPGAAENEALTMGLARSFGLQVPPCGLVRSHDGEWVYWIRRFDRWEGPPRQKLRCEDFCQVLEVPTSWKYAGNLESIADKIRELCSDPDRELMRLFVRTLFCWVTGNEDMHLKNWSLLEVGNNVELAPAYDFLNTVILTGADDEIGIHLRERKKGFYREDLVHYFGAHACGLDHHVTEAILRRLHRLPWKSHIEASELSPDLKEAYSDLVAERLARLG